MQPPQRRVKVIQKAIVLSDAHYARLVKLAFSEEFERIGEWYSQIENELGTWDLDSEYVPSKDEMTKLAQEVMATGMDVESILDSADDSALEELGEAIRTASYGGAGSGSIEYDYPPGHPKHQKKNDN